MKKFLMLFAVIGLAFTSCKKDEDQHDDSSEDYKVEITVDNPTANAVMTMNEAMPVKVTFERGAEEIIHHVKIFVMDADDNVVETILEDHAHVQGSYIYDNRVCSINCVKFLNV